MSRNTLFPMANKQTVVNVGRRWEKIDESLPWGQIKYSIEHKSELCATCPAFKGTTCWVNAMSAPENRICDKSKKEFRAWSQRERL